MSSMKITRRFFIVSSVSAGTAIVSSSKASARNETSKSPVGMEKSNTVSENKYTLTISGNEKSIKLLQFTDIHFNPYRKDKNIDKTTEEIIKKLIDLTQPHLIAITGDVWNENAFGRGLSYLETAVEFFGSLGVPWLYTWGNHDKLSDYTKGHDILAKGKNSMYRGGIAEGNYEVIVAKTSGESLWRFVCLNSNNVGLRDEQRQWVSQWAEANANISIPTFMVCHIPIYQYHTIWESEVASGVKFENVCYEAERGESLAYLKKIPGLKACICGHDHVNDYSGIIEGVDLIYGRATGLGGYGSDFVPKGGKLYALYPDTGEYEWVSITPDNKRWYPEKGVQIEKKEELPWYNELPKE
ncbi:MAG: metallophosphoesterase [Candidatus Hydrogenedens sp.]|nr:metallophosphoesterase [Candidatus Hydrogenedens sp.]